MKRKIGAAVLVGLLGLSGVATGAYAQCSSGVLFDWDEGFAYETAYNPATFISSPGSMLQVVGRVVLFCGPLSGINASDPTKEYTFSLGGLTSTGTTTPTATRWVTTYNGGTFAVYEDATPDAPANNAMPAGPPNADVPSKFQDGTVLLSGTLSNFRTQIVLSGGNYLTSMIANFNVTGGSWAPVLAGGGTGLVTGSWCANNNGTPVTGLCQMPQGYSAITNGKFDIPPTPALESTWGAIKALYR